MARDPDAAGHPLDLLRLLRQRALLTQEELAERSGLSVGTVRGLESGRIRRPRPVSVRLLADALALTEPDRRRLVAAAQAAQDRRISPTRTPPPPQLPVPRQLPPDVADFTGRSTRSARLRRLLTDSGPPRGVVIFGQAGVGKTALAVHVAHQVTKHFRDGLVLVNLRGMDPQPLPAADALGHVLRSLGVNPPQIPAGVDERVALYRSLLGSRRVLVLLDNAVDTSQVRPLLPGSGTSRVLVTSRGPLPVLTPDLAAVNLELLTQREAVALLIRIVGRDRVTGQREAAEHIATLCGRLPLALRIAGARLAGRPHWPLSRLAERLADSRRRLDELAAGDLEVRASLGLSITALAEPCRQALTLLGGLWSGEFTGWLAAAAVNRPTAETEEILEQLVEAQLLDACGGGGPGHQRYRFHDLVRDVARERFTALPAAQRAETARRALDASAQAVHRAAGCLLGTAEQLPGAAPAADGHRAAPIVITSAADAMAWFAVERTSLTAAVGYAAGVGLAGHAWRIAHNSAVFFELRADWDDWRRTHDVALAAVGPAGDRRGEAALRWGLGQLGLDRGVTAEAREHLDRARELAERIRDIGLQARTLRALGDLHWLDSRPSQAEEHYRRGLALATAAGHRASEARCLRGLGELQRDTGRFDEAVRTLTRAVAVVNRCPDRRIAPYALSALGNTHLLAGRPQPAIRSFQQAVAVARSLGDTRAAIQGQRGLADAYRAAGRPGDALQILQEVLVTVRRLGEDIGEVQTLRRLGEALTDLGEYERAVTELRRALNTIGRIGFSRIEAEVRYALGRAELASGDRDAAGRLLGEARRLFERCGMLARTTEVDSQLAAAGIAAR
ncbi:tetratricopeptide repeat protein [Solwaraspora sp. WMMD792]|uniref:ATP-binding protein n=1 Tax=Solwaraspora sp. WMMD792 TaxID=3016099 RepID=UPI00241615B1|nr:tetratricopeptide repeat protein [Solwaraspora sp. WMMD792]MDG4770090.1 tetratricopeptide repeat protein [Solwaraspora sp. WMMD792]